MGSRILAVIAAVAMVAVAITVRSRLDNDDRSSRGSTGSGALRLVCASELRAVCEGIDADTTNVEMTIEPVSATVARLKTAEPDKAEIDGWLTPGPWSGVVEATRSASSAKLFDDAGAALARSPFVLAVWKDKRARLACNDPVDLGCVGDAVNARGFRLGMANDGEAEGVLADAALGVGHSKNKDFATNDLRETDLAEWLAAVDASADRVGRNPGGRSFTELLTFGAAAADGFLSTEAAVGPEFAGAAKRGQLDLVYLHPVATADVLFAPRLGDRGRRLHDIVVTDRTRQRLRDAGWRVAGLPPATGVNTTPGLPQDDGLPSAGVLSALTEVTS